MKHRFLVHLISHTILIVDISEVVPLRINPRTGNTEMVALFRFAAWKEAEQYLRAKGADAEALGQIRKTGSGVLTIV